MLKDRKLVWLLEYVIGVIFLSAVMPFIVHPQPGWSAAHGWAYLLFIACSGITLVSSASAMRQRIRLAKRITQLEQSLAGLKTTQKQSTNESAQKHTAREPRHIGVGSVN